jgi:hypothetical protein
MSRVLPPEELEPLLEPLRELPLEPMREPRRLAAETREAVDGAGRQRNRLIDGRRGGRRQT